MQDSIKYKKLVYLAALASVAIIFGYVESLIPINFGIPGVKLGLANIVTVVMLFSDNNCFDFKDLLIVCLVRILVVGFLFGNLYGILYSLLGGLFSLIMMFLVKRLNIFGVIGVSIVGGIMHNFAQLIVAIIVVEQLKIVYYAPILLFFGTLFGALLGVVGGLIAKTLRININDNHI